MATNGNFAHQEQYKSSVDAYPTAPASADGANSAASNNLSKDEVGWYFVEQYYTTLSKCPEKLHLFYGKRSQFVQGPEAEVANVSVGRPVIQERIKELDFQDCKVRISNVDSQASFDNIVIQVIGETSNKGAEPKKFVQTFVLAQQPSGYFVLNDILRYIKEEDEEEPAKAAAATDSSVTDGPAPAGIDTVEPVESEPEPESADKASSKDEHCNLDATAVDQKLQEVSQVEGTANGGHSPAVEVSKASETKVETTTSTDADSTARELAEEDAKEPEKPQDPSPTPVSRQVPAQPEPAPVEPPAPAKPMTWASRAAAAAGPRPVVPLPKTAISPAQSQGRAPAPTPTPAPAPAPAPAAVLAPVPSSFAAAAAQQTSATAPVAETAPKEASGWQTAGADSKRQNRPQSMSRNFAEKEGTMGYVRYVTERVIEADLRSALATHGELTYFDINRQKNCAFVEYKTVDGYLAAVQANPHLVNGENIVVEPRRPKATAYGGSNYGSGRGTMSGRGRGGFDGSRGGPGGAHGNFTGQNRGLGGMPRGRGGPQANNA